MDKLFRLSTESPKYMCILEEYFLEEKKELQNQDERVVEIELERLRGFVNHPFKVQRTVR